MILKNEKNINVGLIPEILEYLQLSKFKQNPRTKARLFSRAKIQQGTMDSRAIIAAIETTVKKEKEFFLQVVTEKNMQYITRPSVH